MILALVHSYLHQFGNWESCVSYIYEKFLISLLNFSLVSNFFIIQLSLSWAVKQIIWFVSDQNLKDKKNIALKLNFEAWDLRCFRGAKTKIYVPKTVMTQEHRIFVKLF